MKKKIIIGLIVILVLLIPFFYWFYYQYIYDEESRMIDALADMKDPGHEYSNDYAREVIIKKLGKFQTEKSFSAIVKYGLAKNTSQGVRGLSVVILLQYYPELSVDVIGEYIFREIDDFNLLDNTKLYYYYEIASFSCIIDDLIAKTKNKGYLPYLERMLNNEKYKRFHGVLIYAISTITNDKKWATEKLVELVEQNDSPNVVIPAIHSFRCIDIETLTHYPTLKKMHQDITPESYPEWQQWWDANKDRILKEIESEKKKSEPEK